VTWDRCDFFILALHRRWGQAAPDSRYSSYTEEEFQLACKRWEKTKSPEVVVFFKTVDAASLADPGPELKKVMAFRKKLAGGRRTMFRRFSSEVEFAKEVDLHLRAFSKGEWREHDQEAVAINLPRQKIDALNKSSKHIARRSKSVARPIRASKGTAAGQKSKERLTPDLTLVEAERTALALARAAVEAASKQNIEDAMVLFAKASEGTTNLSVLSLAAEFFRQMADAASCGRLIRRQAAIARDRKIAARYYMTLLPKNHFDTILKSMLDKMLTEYPPEAAEVLREVFIEAFTAERIKEVSLDIMVKYYSTEEILELARFLATPEAQAKLSKQPLIITEMMQFGQQEVERVLQRRYPELFAHEPKSIEAAPIANVGEVYRPTD
jgi:hypothetical protein